MALFLQVAELAERLAGEPGKLKKRAAMAEAIRAVEAGASGGLDAGLFAQYLAGTPFAEADARKLNAGGALLTKALLGVTGASDIALSAAYRRYGDLGAAGFELVQDAGYKVQGGLTLAEVAEAFAGMAGARTTAGRLGLVEGLMRKASALEVKYLLKLMSGDMRIGVKQSLVEDAIAAATGAEVAAVRRAVMLEADLAGVVRRAFDGTLGEARMRLFHPLGFMLASPVETPEEAVERFAGKATASTTAGPSTSAARVAQDDSSGVGDEERVIEAFLEDKYDGMRAQVHCGDGTQPGRVAIYSRNKEDVTESFPELAEAFAGVTETLILDGEILGWDLNEGRALPFAVLGQRIGRKRVSNEWRRRVPVVFMAFDLMYADGELLLEVPLRERRNRLEGVVEGLVERVVSPVEVPEGLKRKRRVPEGQQDLFGTGEQPTLSQLARKDGPPSLVVDGAPGHLGRGDAVERLMISPSRLVESAEDIDRAYAEARARANEGVMLKAAGSVYQPGRRGLAWVKLKRELATLDVVVTGAEFGHGKRAGILSDYTFAVRAGGGELLNVGKAYSGLTDVEIAEMSRWMMEHTLEADPNNNGGHFRTVEPLVVLEVAFNNIMRSGRHASGFALRFPRILRIRTDKPVEEIDTVGRVEEIYQSQVDKPVEA